MPYVWTVGERPPSALAPCPSPSGLAACACSWGCRALWFCTHRGVCVTRRVRRAGLQPFCCRQQRGASAGGPGSTGIGGGGGRRSPHLFLGPLHPFCGTFPQGAGRRRAQGGGAKRRPLGWTCDPPAHPPPPTPMAPGATHPSPSPEHALCALSHRRWCLRSK